MAQVSIYSPDMYIALTLPPQKQEGLPTEKPDIDMIGIGAVVMEGIGDQMKGCAGCASCFVEASEAVEEELAPSMEELLRSVEPKKNGDLGELRGVLTRDG